MGLATVDSRRGSDVRPKKTPSGDSCVFPLSVSAGFPNSSKSHSDNTRIGTLAYCTISFVFQCSFTYLPL
jgi:hypothetical protein